MSEDSPYPRRSFATTRWSMVVAASRDASPPAREALEDLCGRYWYPLYAFVRRRGYPREQAEDLTQEFFATLLERQTLALADEQRGRFRSFLLAALKNFLAGEWRKQQTQKRGGGNLPLSIDFCEGEDRYALEPADLTTPEMVFERRWALLLLERAMASLEAKYAADGKEALFAALRPTLTGGGGDDSYAEIGARLEMSEGAVKTAAHRFRRRCREILRGEVAETVDSPEEVDDELRELMAALG